MKYLGLAVVSVFWAAAVSAQAIPRDFTITLDVFPNNGTDPNQLQILSDPQGWDIALKAKGYIGFREHESGTITLKLKVPPNRVMCADYPSAQQPRAWVISKVELSAVGNTITQKGFNFGADQDQWLLNDFQDADLKGIIQADPTNLKTSLDVYNMNIPNGPERWIFYRVTVQNCANPAETLTTDPVWKNGGK